jgi:hypothetical protein
MIAAIVSIPIFMFPILKKHNESLALGYVGARIFEGFFPAFNIISLLSLLSLSREFVNAAAPVASYFQTSGAIILSALDWSSKLGGFPFVLGTLIFNYVLYKSKLIPRWLSGWGFIGGVLYGSGVLAGDMFGLIDPTILFVVLAIQEMALAVWLIVKGFNSSAIAHSEKPEIK